MWNKTNYKSAYGNGNHLQVDYNTNLPTIHHKEGTRIKSPEVPVDPITSPSNEYGDPLIEEGSVDSYVMVVQPGRTASHKFLHNTPTYSELMKTLMP